MLGNGQSKIKKWRENAIRKRNNKGRERNEKQRNPACFDHPKKVTEEKNSNNINEKPCYDIIFYCVRWLKSVIQAKENSINLNSAG